MSVCLCTRTSHYHKGADIRPLTGGKSTVHLDLGPEGKGRFWGKLSNELNPGRRRDGVLEKGGYAGFRNKVRAEETRRAPPCETPARLCNVFKRLTPSTIAWLQSRTTLFGTRTWDTSLHEFLCLRVRSSGDGMRYFVNIQTDGPSKFLTFHSPDLGARLASQ